MNNLEEEARLREVYAQYTRLGNAENKWSSTNPGNRAILEERWKHISRILTSYPVGNLRVLDVGCGTGDLLSSLLDLGFQSEHLHGVDLLADRIRVGRTKYPFMDLQACNAESLPYATSAFDLILTFTVFSSIKDEGMQSNVVQELDRVLSPGGSILWYDFRYDNPSNPHVHGMNKRKIQTLLPDYALELSTITLVPPLARTLGAYTSFLYPIFSRIPLLRTHYIGLLKKLR